MADEQKASHLFFAPLRTVWYKTNGTIRPLIWSEFVTSSLWRNA